MTLKLLLPLACLLASTACQAGSRIIATGGASSIEGSAGGGIVPWAVLNGYASSDEWAATAFAIAGFARAAQQGLGVALIPLPISNSWFSNGSLQRLFEQELLSRDRYYLVRHDDDANRQEIQLLIDWVLQSFLLDN